MQSVNPLTRLLVAAAVALACLTALLPGTSARDQPALMLYCAAALRTPIEQVVASYEAETGVAIHVQYGGSGALLSQIEVSRQGDLFLAADHSFVDLAQEKGLISATRAIASMRLVLAVPSGNPLGIQSLEDLRTRRVAIGAPGQTAIGSILRDRLVELVRWDGFSQLVRSLGVTKPTVTDVANDLLLGSVDAGVLWDAVAKQHPGIEIVEVPEFHGCEASVSIGLLEFARNGPAARGFIERLASPGSGQAILAEFGYSPAAAGANSP